MRIIIHSNAPQVPSGYGLQTKALMEMLRDQGHDVACSCFAGVSGSAIRWGDFVLFPGGVEAFGTDVVAEHTVNWGADVLITLMDTWKLAPAVSKLAQLPCHIVPIVPIDCEPMGAMDAQVLTGLSGAAPVAMTRFGLRQLEDAGFEATYIPHMIDTGVFHPLPEAERRQAREEMGTAGQFIIGINAANQDAVRKAWPEQFEAFARFHKEVPASQLWVHTLLDHPRGHKLASMAAAMGILDAVRFTDQYAVRAGLLSPKMINDWYNSLDVLSACSFAEGFGIPIAEAQAAGIQVITTNFGAMAEVAGKNAQLAYGSKFWNFVHEANWCRPEPLAISAAYHEAYRNRKSFDPGPGRAHVVMQYNTGHVAEHYWRPFMQALADTPKPHEEFEKEDAGSGD